MILLPYLVALPLGAAVVIALLGGRWKKVGDLLPVAVSLASTILAFRIVFALKSAPLLIYRLTPYNPPMGLALIADGLSGFFLLIMNAVTFLVICYAVGYMEKYSGKWKFYTLFLILLTGINGILLAGDLFNLYLFLEVAAIAGYFLVAFGTDVAGLEASFKYAVMGALASSFILLGLGLLYMLTGTLNMTGVAVSIAQNGSSKMLFFISVLFLMGFGLKAALVPFHAWLPYAHSAAPAPVSAMLSGVSIKVLGIYALVRIFFNVFGMTVNMTFALMVFAVLSMVLASFMAFGQTDVKRLFAYSSISQVGYIALGLSIATPLGIFGALFHLLNHSVFKSLLFLGAGAMERVTGTRDLGKIRDLVRRDRVTGYTSLVGALSICGMPPFGGFWSKMLIILACVMAGRFNLALIAALVAVLTLAYYFRALTPALFGPKEAVTDSGPKDARVGVAMAMPMIALALLCLWTVCFMLPGDANGMLLRAANTLGGGFRYAANVMRVLE